MKAKKRKMVKIDFELTNDALKLLTMIADLANTNKATVIRVILASEVAKDVWKKKKCSGAT